MIRRPVAVGRLGRRLRGVAALAALLPLAAAAGCTVVGAPAGQTPEPAAGAPPGGPDGAPPPAVAPPASPPRSPPAPSDPSRTTTPTRYFPEVRAVWVVRTTMNRAESIRAMVDRAAAAGVNTLLLQVRGRGDAYYRSRWEPRAESVVGTPGFDPLALAIEEAHARGMAVHAWVNTHLVHGLGEPPASPDHLVNAHPDWLAVPRALGRELAGVAPEDPRYRDTLLAWARANADRVEGVYSSPSHPAVQERVYSVWMELAERYDLDGIHFDYVRYPSSDFDYSAGALDRFRDWVAPRLPAPRVQDLDRARAADPFAYPEALPDAWAEFRRDQVTGLVERVYHGVKARRPELLVSAAVFPDASDAYRSRYQDWEGWLAAGIVDVVVPMAYTTDDAVYRTQVRRARTAAGDRTRVWAGVGAYLNGVEGTVSKIGIAREEGAGGLVLFSYDWMAGEGSPAGSTPFLRRVGASAFDAR